MNRTRFFFPMIALLALAACENSTGSEANAPARLDVVSGDLQSGTAGAELASPLVVKVVDDKGKPVRGAVVNFRVVAGGGSVFAGTAQTTKDGVAQERWTLGTSTADSQKVEVRAVDGETGEAQVFAVFRATAAPAAPARVAIVGAAAKTGAAGDVVADSPAVKVTDSFGNPVPGVAVGWTASAGSTVTAPTSTNAAGVAKAAWTLPARVDTSFAATATVGSLGSVQFTALAVVPATAVLEKVSGDGQSATPTVAYAPLVVRLRLADGRPVSGAQVAWTSTLDQSGAQARTDADGLFARTLVAATTVGSYPVQAAAGATQVQFSLNVTPGAVASIVRVGGWSGIDAIFQIHVAGQQVADAALHVRLLDAWGNRVPGAPVQYTVTSGGGTVSPETAVTDAQGEATTVWTLGPVVGGQSARATSPGSAAPPLGAGGPVYPAAPARVDITPTTLTLPIGQTHTFTAIAYDRFGNVVPEERRLSRSLSWNRTGGLGNVQFDIGIPSGSVQAYTSGPATITARMGDRSGESASGTATVTIP